MKKCAKCGSEFEDRFKFCPECGSATGMSAQSGMEAELSVGNMRTMAGSGQGKGQGQSAVGSGSGQGDVGTVRGDACPPDGEAQSMGDMRTIGPQEAGGGDTGPRKGVPLADRYELLEEIGQGGFAKVWKARDRKLGRVVAVKRLLAAARQGEAEDQQTQARFRREAQAIAQLNHRNIVAVYDHDRDAEGDYIVMEYVDGGTLRDYLKRQGGALPVTEAVALVRGIAQGLAYAHRKNLVHRDIKPGNVLLQKEGTELIPKIVDFGLARVGGDSELSMTGYGMGTPWYMPPEQRRDAKSVNHTADIYALGKTLYELVTGEIPDNVDPEKMPKEGRLSEVVFKCIKSNPAERFFSAEELIQALDGVSASGAAGYSGKKGTGEGVCPGCGASNASDAKFCESCGAGMTRLCPECGRENSIHKQFCGGCGTDVEGFCRFRDGVSRMEKSAKEGQWGRVLKEAALLPSGVRLPGQRGKELSDVSLSLRQEAESAQAELDDLKAAADEAAAEERWGDALAAARLYIDRGGRSPELAARLPELERRADDADWADASSHSGYPLTQAAQAFRHYLESHADGLHVREAEAELGRLERLEALDRDRIRMQGANDFAGAERTIRAMAKAGLSDTTVLLLRDALRKEKDAFEAGVRHKNRRRMRILWGIAAVMAVCMAAQVATSRRAEQKRTKRVSVLWREALEAKEAGNWAGVGSKAEEILALRPEYVHALGLKAEAVAAALAAARQAKAAGQWRACIDKAGEALALEAGNAEAAALKREAEATIVPKEGELWASPATGMEFVWVPALKVWVGKHEVTNGEYRKKEPGHDSKDYKGHSLNGERQPAVYVNFDDAKAYAAWLTERDRDGLGGLRYRVISEKEWETVARCGDNREYPWGNAMPPKYGNYSDSAAKRDLGFTGIDGYTDGFAVTCPVERSGANEWGLCGIGGNVWECCASDTSGGSFGAWRGASWLNDYPGGLRVAYRDGIGGSYRGGIYGFRLALSR